MKRALITGIGGQDGSYLADHLLELGYEVHGIVRRSSTGNLRNIAHCLDRITLHQADVTDYGSLQRAVCDSAPNEIYHEADQDNVDWSLSVPGYSIDVTVKGVSNLLEIVNYYDAGDPSTRVFIPCSSTMFASSKYSLAEESTFNPQSPYAIGKVAAYNLARYYRETHGMFVSTGILFNHDSVRRYGNYLLHKICRAAIKCAQDLTYRPTFSNVNEEVTVGWAPEFVIAFHKMLQLDAPDDFVLGSERDYSIETLLARAFGRVSLGWKDHIDVTSIPNRATANVKAFPYCGKAEHVLDWKCDHAATDVVDILMDYYKQVGV